MTERATLPASVAARIEQLLQREHSKAEKAGGGRLGRLRCVFSCCAPYAFVALPSIAGLPLPIWIRRGFSTSAFLAWISSTPLL